MVADHFFCESIRMDSTPDKIPSMEAGPPAIVRNAARLTALRHTALLDSPAEEAFDRLTRLVTKILHVPTALVSLIDEDRQYFKSCIGLPEPWASQRETPLSHSFCQHTINSGDPLVIVDAREHPLVYENLAIGDLNVVAYAGIPLVTASGHALGSFCAIDSQPRVWTTDEIEILKELAASVIAEIELRITTRQAQYQAAIQQLLAEVSRVLVDSLECETTLQDVAQLVVPLLADACVIDIIEEDGSRRHVASAALDTIQEPLMAQVLHHLATGERLHPLVEAARTGEPRWLPLATDGSSTIAWQPEYAQAAQALKLQSGLVVPMRARGHTVGVMTFISTRPGYRYEASDLIIAQDIAHRAALAVDNTRLYQVARQALQARDNMLAMVSHDLKSPLGVIKGYAHLVNRRIEQSTISGKEMLQESLSQIDQAVHKMVYLLDELLDVTHFQAGQPLVLHYDRTDLVKLVRQTVQEQQSISRRHQIQIKAHVPELIGLYDVVRMERVLINLLANAVKYSPPGGNIHVSVTTERDSSGDWAIICVQDHGIGIPAADVPHIFQRFYRAGNVGSIKGTGIGLATVEWIVTQHGGTVTLESTEGVGTTVVLRLPHAAEHARAQASQ